MKFQMKQKPEEHKEHSKSRFAKLLPLLSLGVLACSSSEQPINYEPDVKLIEVGEIEQEKELPNVTFEDTSKPKDSLNEQSKPEKEEVDGDAEQKDTKVEIESTDEPKEGLVSDESEHKGEFEDGKEVIDATKEQYEPIQEVVEVQPEVKDCIPTIEIPTLEHPSFNVWLHEGDTANMINDCIWFTLVSLDSDNKKAQVTFTDINGEVLFMYTMKPYTETVLSYNSYEYTLIYADFNYYEGAEFGLWRP